MAEPLVLVIEDDPDIGTSLVEVLEYLDIPAELINNGLQALERIRRQRPKLVLLDIHLPGKSGLEILSEIRGDPNLDGMKVVMVTADGFLTEAGFENVDGVLLKPYTITQLSDVVLELLK